MKIQEVSEDITSWRNFIPSFKKNKIMYHSVRSIEYPDPLDCSFMIQVMPTS